MCVCTRIFTLYPHVDFIYIFANLEKCISTQIPVYDPPPLNPHYSPMMAFLRKTNLQLVEIHESCDSANRWAAFYVYNSTVSAIYDSAREILRNINGKGRHISSNLAIFYIAFYKKEPMLKLIYIYYFSKDNFINW